MRAVQKRDGYLLRMQAKAVSDYQGTTTRKSYAPGVAFPLTEKAIESLLELKKEKQERTCNFVSLVFIKTGFDNPM